MLSIVTLPKDSVGCTSHPATLLSILALSMISACLAALAPLIGLGLSGVVAFNVTSGLSLAGFIYACVHKASKEPSRTKKMDLF